MTQLTPEQNALVMALDPYVAAVATAGSGKTTGICEKAKDLKAQGGKFLVLSFSRPAAQVVNDRLGVNKCYGANGALTFHSAGFRIAIRNEPIHTVSRSGRGEDGERYKEFNRIMGSQIRAAFTKGTEEMSSREYREAAKAVKAHAASAVAQMAAPGDIQPPEGDRRYSKIAQHMLDYSRKRSWSGFDTIDLTFEYAIQALEKGGGLPEVMQSLDWIMADEVQDLSAIQYRLLDMMVEESCASLIIVGDGDQCVYQWRNASLEEFLTRCAEYKKLGLSYNFRCPTNVVQAAAKLIEHNDLRVKQPIRSFRKDSKPILVEAAKDPMEEAKSVLAWLQGRRQEGVEWKDLAVLGRTNAVRCHVEYELFAAGIPFRVSRESQIWNSSEVQTIMGFLRGVQRDETYLPKAAGEMPGIGPRTLKAASSRKDREGGSYLVALTEVAKSEDAKCSATKLLKLSALLKSSKHSPGDAIIACSEVFFPRSEEGGGTTEGETSADLIRSLASLSCHFEDLGQLHEYMQSLSDPSTSAVDLSTIHRTKGDEWSGGVAIIGCREGMMPHSYSMDDDEQLEAERRLMYVAMTRTGSELFFTYPETDEFNKPAVPSRFLREAGLVSKS